jgi:tetratricopeptide (TPR) repeat protein
VDAKLFNSVTIAPHAHLVCLQPASTGAWGKLSDALFEFEQRKFSVSTERALQALVRLSPQNESFVVAFHRALTELHGEQHARFTLYDLMADGVAIGAAFRSAAQRAYDLGTPLVAIKDFSRAIVVSPVDHAATHGLALLSNDRHHADRGRLWLRRASLLRPEESRYLADWLLARSHAGEAGCEEELGRLARSSNDPAVYLALSTLVLERKDFASGEALLLRLLLLLPGSYVGYSKRSIGQLLAGDLAGAERSLMRALIVRPDWIEAKINRARLVELKGDLVAALREYEEAIKQRPDLAEPRFNAAACALALGDFGRGWQHYGARWDANAVVSFAKDRRAHRLKSSKPCFQLESRSRVFVWSEQGLGDEVMFASLIPELLALGNPLLLQCDPRLEVLYRRSFSQAEICCAGDVDETRYDTQIPIGDLGRLLRPDLASFVRSPRGYLKADTERIEEMRRRVRSAGKRYAVGISWSSINPDTGPSRSLPLEQLMDALARPDVQLISMQYGSTVESMRAQQARVANRLLVPTGLDVTNDLDGLAALMSACDLVVSIGNTTAHLAAALGRPTWVLTPKVGSWRWMAHGETTPWYPSTRVFRQSQPGDWASVLLAVSLALDSWIGGDRG